MAAKIFYWDWKEPPPMEAIAEAVAEMSGGGVHMRRVETGSDDYELVVSDHLVDDAEAERLSEENTVTPEPLAQSLPKWWAQQVAEGNVTQWQAGLALGLAPGERLAANGVVIGAGGHPDIPRHGAEENDLDYPADDGE